MNNPDCIVSMIRDTVRFNDLNNTNQLQGNMKEMLLEESNIELYPS